MKTRTVVIVVAILAALAFLVWALRSEMPGKKTGGNGYEITENGGSEESEMSRPWVEVLAATASVKTLDSWEPVNTGDELENGAVVKTDENGLSEIHMPDGSVVRLDSNSQITMTQGDYDASSGNLMVKIELAAGRIWSKIIELATPESFWQVETANAVASVRGTSFGMEFADAATQILGSENTVEVEAVDPVTKSRLGRAQISADKMIRVDGDLIKNIRDRRVVMANRVLDVPEEVRTKPWVNRAALADQIIKRRVEALKARGLSDQEIKRAIRTDLLEKRRNLLIKLQNQGILPRLIAPPRPVTITPAVVAPVQTATATAVTPQVATDTIELLNVR